MNDKESTGSMNIVESNNQFRFYNNVKIIERLEPANYLLKFNTFGFYLERTEQFELPKKVYDVEKEFRELILASFRAHEKNTGILLKGYKGQGKTITAKQICMESKLPIIIISQSIPREMDFVSFLNEIRQEYVVFIDEFEKLFTRYSDDDNPNHRQESLLTLTDGALTSRHKKLFLFTSNDDVDDKFINRPSRIRFFKEYEFMNTDLYSMIIDDLLKHKEFQKDLEENLPIEEATIDLLVSIIKEINILGKPFSFFKEVYNHRSESLTYKLFVMNKDKEFDEMGEIVLTSKPIKTSRYPGNLSCNRMIAVDDNQCVFESHSRHKLLNDYEWEDKGPYIYRLVRQMSVKELVF